MKSFWIKFILWQIWSVVAAYVFFFFYMALLLFALSFIVDLLCLYAYFVRWEKGENVLASIEKNFDFLPYKWWWVSGILGAVSVVHWEEYPLLCCFMWATVLVAYVVDTIDNYGKWKKQQEG